MIFVTNEIYATVWDVKPAENGKYADLRVTTGEKNQDDEWENSTWFIRLVGHAWNSLKDVKREDRIVLTKTKLTNLSYEGEDGRLKSSFKVLVLEAKFLSTSTRPQTNEDKPKKKSTQKPTAETNEDDPW